MFADVYRGLRVLVTGHTGFKGSWLTAWLLGLGAEVAGVSADVPTSPANFEILGLSRRIRDHRIDLRDRGAFGKAVGDFRPQLVFHLAAQALVRKSYEDPALTFESNVMGTMNVLEVLRTAPEVRAAVLITSDKCYRNVEWVWGYRETDALGGYDPYSASKGCAELVAASYMQSYFRTEGPAVATARAGNVVGGGDWAADRIVPDCARAWTEGRAVPIRAPRATRPWQHVLEPLSGYLDLGAALYRGREGVRNEAFNFGPPAEANHTVAEVAEALAARWPGFSTEIDPAGLAGRKEATLLKLCCDKALAALDWKAVWNFGETMAATADWYRAWQAGTADMWAFTSAQIADYVAAAAGRGLPWTR